jgi:hypothetical protein
MAAIEVFTHSHLRHTTAPEMRFRIRRSAIRRSPARSDAATKASQVRMKNARCALLASRAAALWLPRCLGEFKWLLPPTPCLFRFDGSLHHGRQHARLDSRCHRRFTLLIQSAISTATGTLELPNVYSSQSGGTSKRSHNSVTRMFRLKVG